MNKVVYDQEMMGIINLLSRLTKARIKDCFKEEDNFYCVVAKGDIGKAIGKGGETIKKIQNTINKKIKFIEFDESVVKFVKNAIHPFKVDDIVEKEGSVEIICEDRRVKGLLIGRSRSNLDLLNRTVKRFFNVEVKVV
ncbi:NusA-like transcription termination signal-binding factor [Candidatus Woesearchaeota archaeon]|jgi:transcription termination/antitermination protein NusA|nr:NusA-like transcription termination signal-binding factor [Candidatus Woesearchaeota archaeon]